MEPNEPTALPASKPARPAVPPRPYPPKSFKSKLVIPQIFLATQSATIKPPVPPSEENAERSQIVIPIPNDSSTPPEHNNHDVAEAMDKLILQSPPQPSSPILMPSSTVINVSNATSDTEANDSSHVDDIDEVDDDEDVSSTIAVRGVAPDDDEDEDPDQRRSVQHEFEQDLVPIPVSAAAYMSPNHRSANPDTLLNMSQTAATLGPARYDDDDDVRVFQCEHTGSNNGGPNGLGRRSVVNRDGEPLNSFTLARFLENDAGDSTAAIISPIPPESIHHHPPIINEVSENNPSPSTSTDITTNMDTLISLLATRDPAQSARQLYELTQSRDTCIALRQTRCIALCVQIIHSDADVHTRRAARRALHNVVNAPPSVTAAAAPDGADERRMRSETKVLRHIEHVLDYCDSLKLMLHDGESLADDRDRHPLQALSHLMKISFDAEHRQTMGQLGALQAISSIVAYDHAMHGGSARPDDRCVALRRFAAMTMTNLTFGDDTNKAILCANKEFMRALVGQLTDGVVVEDLLPVTANVLRNLSWRADARVKQVLNEIGTVTALTRAAMCNAHNEATLKALLSPLWNLSAHSSPNKAEFCAIDGALAFLVDMLVYMGPSRTWTVAENAGGILRNVSSHIAVNSEYRAVLRRKNALGILLEHLSAESVTIVSNACGTLWNLSARCEEDQRYLLDNRALQRLSQLLDSKHKMIANGSSSALKNLLNCRMVTTAMAAVSGNSGSGSGGGGGGLDAMQKAQMMRTRKMPAPAGPQTSAAAVGMLRKPDLLPTYLADGSNGDNLPPLRITPRTAQMLQNGYMQQQRKFYPPSSGVHHHQQQQPPPPPPPRRLSKPEPLPSPPTPPRRNLMMHQQHPQHLQQQQAQRQPANDQHRLVRSDGTPYQETDLDQITDFSLRYGGDGDVTMDTSGGPRPRQQLPPPPIPPPLPPTRRLIETSVATSGINTPERCTKYAEEGTPGLYDSYSSLDGSVHDGDDREHGDDGDEARNATTNTTVQQQHTDRDAYDDDVDEARPCDDEVPVTYRHTEEEEEELENGGVVGKQSNEPHDADDANADEERDRFPPLLQDGFAPSGRTSPGGSTKGGVAFDTPMMFSRHSSIESLSSVEVPMLITDDGQSVVSDFSRLASGAISPSDIPDSPSQMCALSPRRASDSGTAFAFHPPAQPPMMQSHPHHHGHHARHHPHHLLPSNRVHALPSVFEDDMNRFGVENTPAQISCATSLSNLSIEDDPVVIRLPDGFHAPIGNHPVPVEAMRMSSDEDDDDGDSVGDDDGDDGGQLLAACINIGMKKTLQPSPAWRTGASPVVELGGPRADVGLGMDDGRLSPLSIESDNDATSNLPLLQQSQSHEPIEPLVQSHLIDSSISTSSDSLASNDDGPRSSSALLEQCINSGMHKRPASSASTVITLVPTNQVTNPPIAADVAADDVDDLSDLSDDDDGGSGDLLAACINMGMKKPQATTTGNVLASPARLPQPPTVVAVSKPVFDAAASDSSSSSSTDDAEDVLRLQQCIRLGMTRRADGESAPSPLMMLEQQPKKWPATAALKTSVVDYANGKNASDTASSSDVEADEHVPIDSSILAQCIQMGMHKRPAQPLHQAMSAARPRVPGGSSTAAAPATSRSRSQPAPAVQHSSPFKSVAQIERERHMERERQRERERQMERDRERRDQELMLHFQAGGSGKPNGTIGHHQVQYQQQQQHYQMDQQQQYHHIHHDAAAATATLTEYGCGCSTSGRYRCAMHGGIVGGSMRRRPLPPIPVDNGPEASRRQRRVKTRSKRVRPVLQPPPMMR